MATITEWPLASETEAEGLAFVREVLRIEAEALERVRDRLGDSITCAAELIYRSTGSVIVTGMGKAGLVGQKLAATLASTGTRAFHLHPAEAVHGDLGRIRADDVVLALSQSGETEEVLRLVPALRRLGAGLVAITERASQLARPGGRPVHRAGARRRGLPAGPGPVRQHDGAHGRRRCAGAAGQPDARLHRRGLRAVPSGRQPGAEAHAGRGGHAHRAAAPPGACRRAGAIRLRPPGGAAPALRRRADRRRGTGRCWASSPTATWPGCSNAAARPSWTGRSATS